MTDWIVGAGFKLWDDSRNVVKPMRLQLDNYCLLKDARLLDQVKKVPGYLGSEEVGRRDLLRDEMLTMTKVKVTTIPVLRAIAEAFPVWESDVRASDDFFAQTDRMPGMPWDFKFKKELPQVFDGLDPYLASHWFQAFEEPVPKYLVAAIDIETMTLGVRLPNPLEAEYPVISVTVRGSDGKGCVYLLRRNPGEVAPVVDGVAVKMEDSEFELLIDVFAAIRSYPIWLTHNGDEFDFPYLRNRALRLGFSDVEIPIRDGFSKAYLDAGLHLDLLRWFDNQSVQIYIYATKYKDMDLDSVSKGLIGRGKVQHQESIGRMTLADLVRYNWNDAGLSLELATYDDQYTLMMMTYMSRLSGLFLEDVCRYKVGSWITNIIQREHRRLGCLIPNRDEVQKLKGSQTTTHGDAKGTKYKGAIVVDPVPGVHWNVGLFDFASLYPSIVETWNLGYATVNCCHEECKVKGRRVPDAGHYVCTKLRAIESNFIEVLRGLRVRYYKPLSKKVRDNPSEKRRVKAIEGCLKVVMNASYGVFGSDKFALYYPAVSESIAAIGRYDITSAQEEARRVGFTINYGDTDSIFLGDGSKEAGELLVRWAKDSLGLDFEFAETFYWLILTDRKKNYMGLQESDGKIKVMGMVGKKRNTPAFIRGTFKKVQEILATARNPDDFEKVKKDVAVAIYSAVIDLRRNQIPLEAMAFTMSLSKDAEQYGGTRVDKNGKVRQLPVPQHVRIAEEMDQTRSGTVVTFIKTRPGKKHKGIPLMSAKAVSKVSRDEIDLTLYETMMRSTFAQILDAIKVPWPQAARQMKLY